MSKGAASVHMKRRFASTLAPLLLSVACGEIGGSRADGGSALGSASATDTEGNDDASTNDGADGSGGSTGEACDETCEGVCIDDVCCPEASACQDVCCADTEVCSFGECVTPGADCIDASECDGDEYCEYSLGEPADEGGRGMCQGGASLATGKCLPKPPECPEGVVPEPGETLECLPRCEVIPGKSFSPTVKYAWAGGDAMMAPVVLPLDDDNCDGIVDERDIPEIVFATFDNGAYTVDGTLRAISIVDGQVVEKWSARPVVDGINPGLSIAGGDIDHTPGNEIVVCTETGKVRAFDHDGSELWISDYAGGCFMPSIADFDQDGAPEILVEGAILDGATGAIEATFVAQSSVVAADIDSDGLLEVVGPHTAYQANGTVIATTGLGGRHPAVADLDGDGRPEVTTIDFDTHKLIVWRYDPQQPNGATVVRQGIDINAGNPPCSGDTGGGPPTIADFNGDGTPDVGVAAGIGYAVFDGAALTNPLVPDVDTLLWLTPATDCSSRQTGSSVFDFDGDGSAEVVYGDEQYLRIYDGQTGTVLFETCNTTGTLWEYPLVADVDNDGHADIVAVSNSYSSIVCPADDSKQRGVRVFGDQEGRWVRTRRIWNQHAYHVTNVEEDGSIPTVEIPNWTVARLNNFRQNVQPEGEFSAPDLIPTVLSHCTPNEFGIVARVRNIGQAAVPQGVPVGFYAGDPDAGGALIGTLHTTKVLYPAEAEDLFLLIDESWEELRTGAEQAWVVVDDGNPAHAWQECRVDNNRASGDVRCAAAG